MCRDCFYSLSDRRSYERCEDARKTVVSWACELCTARFGVLESQLFRATGNTETGFCPNTLASVFWPSQVVVYISLGTSRNLNSFYCRSPINQEQPSI